MQTNSIQPSSSSSSNSTATFELTELDICLARCTNPLTTITDELIDQLCSVTNSQTNGPYTTLRFLAYKAQSPQESEALHSLLVLELIAKRGGYRIADELGKFRFLNEIIKIVSPKVSILLLMIIKCYSIKFFPPVFGKSNITKSWSTYH
ncbi:hypothetical protein BLA29_003304 [Euroglyphus maynei]|uniref:VHS domain-containing protein n=1 Tax=Euroglyphus maynei TaxID=6958 RepID=A0A1Y3BUP2_EURMA|nr:hypothetical protein BLA29_003304 [Euroglyphus maynei]